MAWHTSASWRTSAGGSRRVRGQRVPGRNTSAFTGAAVAALLLTSCTGEQEDPMGQDSNSEPTGQEQTTGPGPDSATTAPGSDDGSATSQAPDQAPTESPDEFDLDGAISDEVLLEQTRWALDLLAEDAGVVPEEEFAERFDATFQDQLTALDLSMGMAPLRLAGPYTVTHAAESEGVGRSASLALHSEQRPLILSIGLDDEGRIAMLYYQDDTSGDPPPIKSWADLDAALEELDGRTQVVVGEVRDGVCQTVHTTEGLPAGGDAWPTGSVFKLLVLAGVVDAVEAGELAWGDELEITEAVKSLPSGILQDQEAGSTVTVEEAAGLMISISDNTATDLLIEAVGQERLRTSAELAGVDAERVAPVQTTRELFILGWGVDQEVRDRWANASTPEQRQAMLDDLPVDVSVVDVATVTTPVWQDGVDWLLTGGEVCAIHARLQQQATTEAGAPVREILSANPGGPLVEGVTYQGFKGGSAPGVLALSYYVETDEASNDGSNDSTDDSTDDASDDRGQSAPDGYVLVVQTGSESTIDQLRAATIAEAGLRHLAGHGD